MTLQNRILGEIMWKDEIKKREDLFLQGRKLVQGLGDNKELLNSAKVLISRVTDTVDMASKEELRKDLEELSKLIFSMG